jgi:prevent-host-death family protein
MTKSLSTAEIKAHLSESIDLAIQEGFVTITRYGKPVAAIVSIEDLEQLQRLRAARLGGGLANLAQEWEDADEFADKLDKVVRERHQNISIS